MFATRQAAAKTLAGCYAIVLILVAALSLPTRGTASDVQVTSFEGESFAYSGQADVVSGLAYASGGSALRLYTNAVATETLATPAASRLTVKARKGADCTGKSPHMTVKMDGVRLLSTNVTATNFSSSASEYSITADVSAGSHTFSVINDSSDTSCDRALRFDVLRVGAPIWVGNFETGDISQWALNQSCPGQPQIVTSPSRAGRYAAAFTVTDRSTIQYCPDVAVTNPNAHLNSPALFAPGDERYVGASFFFPAGFPQPPSWFQVFEIYGPPFGGSPTMEIDVEGDRLTFARDETHGYDMPWRSSTAIGGRWEDVVLHVKMSTDPSVGFVELWHNGVRQTFDDGSKTLRYNTIVPSVNGGGPNRIEAGQYRSKVAMGTVTTYMDEVRIGPTYESVAP